MYSKNVVDSVNTYYELNGEDNGNKPQTIILRLYERVVADWSIFSNFVVVITKR